MFAATRVLSLRCFHLRGRSLFAGMWFPWDSFPRVTDSTSLPMTVPALKLEALHPSKHWVTVKSGWRVPFSSPRFSICFLSPQFDQLDKAIYPGCWSSPLPHTAESSASCKVEQSAKQGGPGKNFVLVSKLMDLSSGNSAK